MSELSSSKSSTQLPSPTGVVASLQKEIHNMEGRFEDLRQAQSAARSQTIMTVLVILVIFLGFFFAGYLKIRSNFSEEQVRGAMLQPAFEVRQAVLDRMGTVAQNVAPVYGKLLLERARIAGPEIGNQFKQEISKLPEDVGKLMLHELGQSFSRVNQKAQSDLKVLFPDLSGQGAEQQLAKLTVLVDKETTQVVDQVQMRVRNEQEKLLNILTKFPPAPETHDPNLTLWDTQRMLARTLLKMLDYEIANYGKEGIEVPLAQ